MRDQTDVASSARAESDDSESAGPAGRSGWLIAALAAGVGLVILAVVYLVDLLATSGELERNTTVAGVQVGGMTPEQASAALTAQALPAYAQSVTIDVHGEQTTRQPSSQIRRP